MPTITRRSFGGCDIRVVIGGQYIFELQGISWTVSREVGSDFVLGHENLVAYSKNKRGIAGTMVALTLDAEAILFTMQKANIQSYVWSDDGGPGDTRDPTPGDDPGTRLRRVIRYLDQMPLFDIIIEGQNETGQKIKGSFSECVFTNSGSGTSIDDTSLNVNVTFQARSWSGMSPAGGNDLIISVAKTKPFVKNPLGGKKEVIDSPAGTVPSGQTTNYHTADIGQ